MAKLKRTLDLWQLTLIGVGIIIGAGIYVLLGQASGLAGNAVWMSFILASLAAVFTGMSYAELSSIFPKAGAEYVYVNKTLGKRLAWMVGWTIVINGFMCAATVSMGFANYFSALFNTPVLFTAIGLMLVITAILIKGMKESAFLAIAFTLIETAGLLVVIFVGIPYLGSVNYLEMANGFSGILQAGTLIFFAFIGFETIARLSEDTKNPKKTVPLAIVLAIAITTFIYILVSISAVSIIGWKALSESASPMATIANAVLGSNAFIALALVALFSTCNTVIVVMLTTSRLIYGIAEFGILPKSLRKLSKGVPWMAVIATTVPSMAFLMIGNIKTVANLTNFTIFIAFIMVNACVIWMRMKNTKCKACFRTPFSIGKIPVLPVLGILTCLFMLTGVGAEVFFYGVALITFGMLLYEFREHRINRGKKKPYKLF
jgi:APA family basic amino acid/polyamine antiporter